MSGMRLLQLARLCDSSFSSTVFALELLDMLEECEIESNEVLKGDYRKVVFKAPGIAPEVKPGQFAHVQIAKLRDRILRRPFSICGVNETAGTLVLVYKIVGEGTAALARLAPGERCSFLAPRGTPFSIPGGKEKPVIVAGGYGSAATLILAKRSVNPGFLLLGAKTSEDLILIDEFEKIGFDVRVATEDGSQGAKGLVTDLLCEILGGSDTANLAIKACGPHGMLMAVGKMLLNAGLDGELSLDHLMCCGVGACFACVVKVKAENDDGWRYARTCSDGPVFKASEVWYGEL
ncbi:MAG: dihydroorotate dehydrogenase electron transfer subunit [Victivallales bacterium]|nr:dihydroorotate dehydrogenase electron transfer subunit [Victivallales bacterium]